MRTRAVLGLDNLTISIDMISLNHTFILFSLVKEIELLHVYKEASVDSMDMINMSK